MKYIKLILISLWAVIFLSACSGSGKGTNNVANDPTEDTPTEETVKINQGMQAGGKVSHIDLIIKLPAGTTQSLLDYSGQVNISGSLTMSSTLLSCSGTHSFSCTAQLAGGTINAGQSSCSIGHGIQLWSIIIFRSPELKTTYGISGIGTNEIPYNCYLPGN